MAKSEVDKVTEEKVSKGGILAKLYFDMRHEQKDKLQPLMVDLINERLMKEPGIVYCYGAIDEPMEHDGSFVTSGIITVLFEAFVNLVHVTFKYAPAGIEILKPTHEIRFNISDLQTMLMDISNTSVEYSKFILEKVLSDEDKRGMLKHLDDREMIGKKHMDSRKDKPDKS